MSHASKETALSGSEVLVIRASEWLRGTGAENSGLYRDGRCCCLGLDARRCGFDVAALRGRNVPVQLMGLNQTTAHGEYVTRWVTPAHISHREMTARAMSVNDDKATSDEEKIAALRPIFAKHGIEIDWRPNE